MTDPILGVEFWEVGGCSLVNTPILGVLTNEQPPTSQKSILDE